MCGLSEATSIRAMFRAPRAPRLLFALLTPLLLIAGASGCSKDEDPSTLPDGATLLSESATAMQSVQSSHIVIEVDGAIGSLPIKRAEGDLKREGDAQGNIQLQQFGQLIQLDFVLLGDDAYLKFPTGGWQKQAGGTSSFPYDPSAILDPSRGIAKLLSTATNARTEGSENVGGVDTYRVAVDFDNTAASALVPGVPPGVKGHVWLDKQSKHLVKAVVNSPANGSTAAATMTVTLTKIDVPVTISAP
jgi:lipoprotein LprG